MINKKSKKKRRVKATRRVRGKITGTPNRPRLSIFKSNKHMHAQIIDDVNAITLVAASTVENDISEKIETTSNKEAARLVGETIAKRALDKNIESVVFDRSGFIFHGRVKELADGAREAGLKF